MRHHIRLQCPEELWMMVSEVLLDCFEELCVGLSRELRPALALGQSPQSFIGQGGITRPHSQRSL